jgi:crossover junction endodeoxyribonuclease RuvC
MIKNYYIGIDPGKSGGVCVLNKFGSIEYMSKCPNTETEMSYLLEYPSSNPEKLDQNGFAIIEKVHSFKGQGVVSTFTFGKNYGTWLGILSALKIPHKEEAPQKWMKHFGSMPKEKKDRKNHLKRLAQQRYPNEKITLNIADAVMIALYNYETYNKLKESE